MSEFSHLISEKNFKQLRQWFHENGTLEIVEELTRSDPEQRAIAFRLIPKARAIDVFEMMDPSVQQQILNILREPRAREILEELEPDDRARLLDEMPPLLAKKLLEGLSFKERRLTSLLLGYPENSVGRIMSPEFVDLEINMTANEAIARVRSSGRGVEAIYSLPVIDQNHKFIGTIDLGDLVLADCNITTEKLLTEEAYSVKADESQEKASRLLLDLGLIALPVVDSEEKLAGVLTFDDAMEVLQESDTEDYLRTGASEPLREPYLTASMLRLTKTRAVWLLVLALAATLTVNVLNLFQSTLESVLTLSLFIPLLIGIGGNIGSQSATIIIRAMALGEIRFGDTGAVLFREIRVGALLGLVLGIMGFIFVSIVFGINMAIILSLSLFSIAVLAAFAGSLLPMTAKKIGIDPAVVSAPIISTLVDASGLIIYFLIAKMVLSI